MGQNKISLTIDGKEVQAAPGQTILEIRLRSPALTTAIKQRGFRPRFHTTEEAP